MFLKFYSLVDTKKCLCIDDDCGCFERKLFRGKKDSECFTDQRSFFTHRVNVFQMENGYVVIRNIFFKRLNGFGMDSFDCNDTSGGMYQIHNNCETFQYFFRFLFNPFYDYGKGSVHIRLR